MSNTAMFSQDNRALFRNNRRLIRPSNASAASAASGDDCDCCPPSQCVCDDCDQCFTVSISTPLLSGGPLNIDGEGWCDFLVPSFQIQLWMLSTQGQPQTEVWAQPIVTQATGIVTNDGSLTYPVLEAPVVGQPWVAAGEIYDPACFGIYIRMGIPAQITPINNYGSVGASKGTPKFSGIEWVMNAVVNPPNSSVEGIYTFPVAWGFGTLAPNSFQSPYRQEIVITRVPCDNGAIGDTCVDCTTLPQVLEVTGNIYAVTTDGTGAITAITFVQGFEIPVSNNNGTNPCSWEAVAVGGYTPPVPGFNPIINQAQGTPNCQWVVYNAGADFPGCYTPIGYKTPISVPYANPVGYFPGDPTGHSINPTDPHEIGTLIPGIGAGTSYVIFNAAVGG